MRRTGAGRRGGRRTPPSQVRSISCTDADWERIRVLAEGRDRSISRCLVECALSGEPDRPAEGDPLRAVAARLDRILERLEGSQGGSEAILPSLANAAAFLADTAMREALARGDAAGLGRRLAALLGGAEAEAVLARFRRREARRG